MIFVLFMVVQVNSQQTGIHINKNTPVDSLILIPEGKTLLEKYFPGISTFGKESAEINIYFTLGSIISSEDILKLQIELSEVKSDNRKSLDEVDREIYNPGSSPLDIPVEKVNLQNGEKSILSNPLNISLDGNWLMAEGGDERERLNNTWEDPIPSIVPGSVHTAMVAAGKLPDPTFGKNQMIVRVLRVYAINLQSGLMAQNWEIMKACLEGRNLMLVT